MILCLDAIIRVLFFSSSFFIIIICYLRYAHGMASELWTSEAFVSRARARVCRAGRTHLGPARVCCVFFFALIKAGFSNTSFLLAASSSPASRSARRSGVVHLGAA